MKHHAVTAHYIIFPRQKWALIGLVALVSSDEYIPIKVHYGHMGGKLCFLELSKW